MKIIYTGAFCGTSENMSLSDKIRSKASQASAAAKESTLKAVEVAKNSEAGQKIQADLEKSKNELKDVAKDAVVDVANNAAGQTSGVLSSGVGATSGVIRTSANVTKGLTDSAGSVASATLDNAGSAASTAIETSASPYVGLGDYKDESYYGAYDEADNSREEMYEGGNCDDLPKEIQNKVSRFGWKLFVIALLIIVVVCILYNTFAKKYQPRHLEFSDKLDN